LTLIQQALIMAFGVKPIAPVLWKRDNFWLYGVVEPLSGWHFCQEYDRLNTQRFQEFIDALSHQPTVYTEVDSELVSIPKRWIQTVGVHEQA